MTTSSTPSGYRHWTRRRNVVFQSFIWTTLFCIAIAILLWLVGLGDPFSQALVVSLTIGWSILAVHRLLGAQLEASLGLLATNTIATALGLMLALGLLGIYTRLTGIPIDSLEWGTAGPALFFGVLGTIVFTSMARMHQLREDLSKAEVERVDNERALAEAKLKTLQAQIEPHFLFNTLTTAIGLIRDNPTAAEQTLQQLTSLLRNSLSRTRTEQSTLEQEFALISAYLSISKIRMGDRLAFSIKCADDLAAFELPPMLVQPLVENALTHGLEPAEQGGEIWVEAARLDDGVEITVIDSGLGLQTNAPTKGTNTGLRNVRERVQQLYGTRGSLRLTDHRPTGVKATLFLPHRLQ